MDYRVGQRRDKYYSRIEAMQSFGATTRFCLCNCGALWAFIGLGISLCLELWLIVAALFFFEHAIKFVSARVGSMRVVEG